MNEGWASYWHTTIMTEKALKASEIIDYADHHAGTLATRARPAQPLQARHRAVPRHRGALGQGPLRQGVGRVRRLRDPAHLGQAPRPGPREDLRGAQALQRRDLHRRVPHPGLLPRAQVLLLRLNERSGNYEIDSREFQKVKQQAAVPADQLRPAVHRRRGRQLREPRRAAAAATATRASTCTTTTPAPPWPPSSASGAARSTCAPSSTASEAPPLRRQGTHRETRLTS